MPFEDYKRAFFASVMLTKKIFVFFLKKGLTNDALSVIIMSVTDAGVAQWQSS